MLTTLDLTEQDRLEWLIEDCVYHNGQVGFRIRTYSYEYPERGEITLYLTEPQFKSLAHAINEGNVE